jgi:two-component system, HptB-dependent secretion and biofilm response regulator
MRVLVADDDPLNREIMARFLARLGVEALFAADGEEAVELVRAERAGGRILDLAFLDLSMPRMGGIEAASLISASRIPRASASSTAPAKPILIALTGADAEDDLAGSGFSRFLQKPLTLAVLRATLDDFGGMPES